MIAAILFAVLSGCLTLACGSQVEPSLVPQPPEPPEFTEVEAPIVDVAIGAAESWPLQYFAWITAGLPNGCHTYSRTIEDRVGATITVTVLNMVPTSREACDMRWREHEISVALGTDFRSGDPYVVIVNGEPHAFVAQ